MNTMSRVIRGARACKAVMGKLNIVIAVICGAIVFLYMFLVSANIGGRYFFNRPIDGTLQIGQMVLATVVFFSLAYAQMKDSHIRVIAILRLLSKKWQNRIETVILAVGFLMMILMAWRSVPFAMESFWMREADMSVDVPIWPAKFVFLIGWSMLGFEFFIEFINRIFPESAPDNNLELGENS